MTITLNIILRITYYIRTTYYVLNVNKSTLICTILRYDMQPKIFTICEFIYNNNNFKSNLKNKNLRLQTNLSLEIT